MRAKLVIAAVAAMLVGGASVALYASAQAPTAAALQPVSAFASISDSNARSAALFTEAGKVIQHPRCVNCHPRTDRPNQGDRGTPHQPLVVRGEDGHGAPGMKCTTCHQAANFDPARIPGDPHWALAPASMAWEGKSLREICEQIKDPARNGKRELAAIVKHMSEDSLVGWAWHPGADRTPAPGTQAQFGQIISEWAKTGAVCPRA